MSAEAQQKAERQARVTVDWHRRTGEPTEGAELVAFELAQAVLALSARVKVLEEALRQIAESDDYYLTSYLEMDGLKLNEWARSVLAAVSSSPAGEDVT